MKESRRRATLPRVKLLRGVAAVPALVPAQPVPKRPRKAAVLPAQPSRLRRSTLLLQVREFLPLPVRKLGGAASQARQCLHRIRRSSLLLQAQPTGPRRPRLCAGDVPRALPLLPQPELLPVARPQQCHGADATELPAGQ